MITAIVHFKLPASIDAAKAAELFQGSAPKYQGLTVLIGKYYLFDAESRTGGGCYLWESREAAERVYTAEWRNMIAERYGAAPEISFFETPVVVDNTLGKTILDAAKKRYKPRRGEGATRPRPTKGFPCLPIRCC